MFPKRPLLEREGLEYHGALRSAICIRGSLRRAYCDCMCTSQRFQNRRTKRTNKLHEIQIARADETLARQASAIANVSDGCILVLRDGVEEWAVIRLFAKSDSRASLSSISGQRCHAALRKKSGVFVHLPGSLRRAIVYCVHVCV